MNNKQKPIPDEVSVIRWRWKAVEHIGVRPWAYVDRANFDRFKPHENMEIEHLAQVEILSSSPASCEQGKLHE